MRVSRGTRLHGRLQKRTSRQGGIGAAQLFRIALTLLGLSLTTLGWSWQSLTDDPFDVHALDSIYLGSTPAYQEGFTSTGVRYKILRNEGVQIYSDYYRGFNPGHDRVRIEFDPPVAAVGAECLTAGFHSVVASPVQVRASQPTLYFIQSGYRALVGDAEAISEITLVTDSGPLVVNRIDLRPFPVARHDTATCLKNGIITRDEGSVIGNDANVEGALLVSAPLHATKFELHEDGTFLYVPEKDYAGLDSFEYRAVNGGGSTFSRPVMATLNVLARNSAPTFENSGDISCAPGSGEHIWSRWAYNMDAGAADEQSQGLYWDVQTDRPDLFVSSPELDAEGNLIFEPTPDAYGAALVTVTLRDEGGRANGGQDLSAPATFSIRFEPAEAAPILPVVPDLIVDPVEGLHLFAASRTTLSANSVRYSLEAAPKGAEIDAETGMLNWSPPASAVPGLYEFRVCATESGPLQLSSVIRFRAEILEETSPIARAHAALRYALRTNRYKALGSTSTSGMASMALERAGQTASK